MTRIALIACLVGAAAFLFAGCGSSGGGGSTAPASTSASARSADAEHGPSGSEAAPKARSSSPPHATESHHEAATGAASFETKGGDNSIQESGSEGSASELKQAAASLHGYLAARAAGEWGRACSYMANGLTTSLRHFAGSTAGGSEKGGRAPSCAKLLAALSAGIPASARREAGVAEAGALRTEGNRAFLLFHGARGTDYFMPMAMQGGKWTVAAVAPSALS